MVSTRASRGLSTTRNAKCENRHALATLTNSKQPRSGEGSVTSAAARLKRQSDLSETESLPSEAGHRPPKTLASCSTTTANSGCGILVLHDNEQTRPKVRLGQRGASKLMSNAMFASVDVDLGEIEASARLQPAPKRAFQSDRAAADESAKRFLVPVRKKATVKQSAAVAAASTCMALVAPADHSGSSASSASDPMASSALVALPAAYALVASGGCASVDPPSPMALASSAFAGEDGTLKLLELGSQHPAWSDLPLPRGVGKGAAAAKAEANATQLRRLRRFLVSLGAPTSIVDGWSTEIKWSRSAQTYGRHATWYVAPTGRRLSSELEVARYFGILSSDGGSSAGGSGGSGGSLDCRNCCLLGDSSSSSKSSAGGLVSCGGGKLELCSSASSSSVGAQASNIVTTGSEGPLITLLTDGGSSRGAPESSIVSAATSSSLTGEPPHGPSAGLSCGGSAAAAGHLNPSAKSLVERNALKRGGRARVVESAARLLSDGPSCLQETVPMPHLRNLDRMLPPPPSSLIAAEEAMAPSAHSTALAMASSARMSSSLAASRDLPSVMVARPALSSLPPPRPPTHAVSSVSVDSHHSTTASEEVVSLQSQPAKRPPLAETNCTNAFAARPSTSVPLIVLSTALRGCDARFASPGRIKETEDDSDGEGDSDEEEGEGDAADLGILKPMNRERRQYAQEACSKVRRLNHGGFAAARSRRNGGSKVPLVPGCALREPEAREELLGLFKRAREAEAAEVRDEDAGLEDIDADSWDEEDEDDEPVSTFW